MSLGELAGLSASALTGRLYALRTSERVLLVEFLRGLGELDRRKAYLDAGFSSAFAFCTDHLGLSRSSTFRRIMAARLLMRFPVVEAYVADGRVTVTNLVELRDVLGEENVTSVLDRASGRTEEQVRDLVAALRPRPAPPDTFRRLPSPRATAPANPLQLSMLTVSTGPVTVDGASLEPRVGPGPATPVHGSSLEPHVGLGAATPDGSSLEPRVGPGPATPVHGSSLEPNVRLGAATPVRGSSLEPRVRRGTIEPISAGLRVLRITVSAEFAADLEAVRDALSHQIPDRGLEKVIHESLRRVLRDVRRRRTGGGRTAHPASSPARGRHVSAAVRTAVWQRDEGRCAFVSSDGRRCGSTYQLELHHVQPFARGGQATTDNLTVACSRHNRFHADNDFGSDHMAAAIRERRCDPAKRSAAEADRPSTA